MLTNGLIRLWENPEVLQLNKLPAHSSFEHYPSAASARAGGPNPWKLDLDGEWDFFSADSPEEAEKLAWSRETRWSKITVPGHPEMQGHGSPHYTNVQMPYSERPPKVPAINPTGVFRRVFELPSDWIGRRVVLHFGSAESLLAVWINGVAVGLSKGSRLPAEFDLSQSVGSGGSFELVAMTPKWSDANFIEGQDMWWLSGLPRSVCLLAMPMVHFSDIVARPHLRRSGDGELELRVTLGHLGPRPHGAKLRAKITTPDGVKTLIGPWPFVFDESSLAAAYGEVVTRVPVPNCQPWSCENPALYLLELELSSGGQKSYTALRIGFRRVEVRDGALWINGRRVLLFGVNRHNFDPIRGRAVSRSQMLEDVRLMKRFHFNAVRCSHYPPDPYWLELCDEYGLYVIDEADAESHAFHNLLCDDPRYATAWLDRCMRMVQRDRNHPSIILWSLGNESGFGANHTAAAGWVRHADPDRPLHYEGAISLWQSGLSFLHGQSVTDVICPMYTPIEVLQKMEACLDRIAPKLKKQSTVGLLEAAVKAVPPEARQPWRPALADPVHPAERPIILCEYSHAMGNSNGSLHDYFSLFRRSRRIQGGFIWEWADQGVRRQVAEGRAEWAYGGDFGDRPHDANFCCDGLVGPDRQLHPAMFEHRHLAQPVWVDDDLTLENRQDFTDLGWLKAEWRLLVEGRISKRGTIRLPQLAPGARRKLKLPLGHIPEGHVVLDIVFRARKDHGVFLAGEAVAWNQIVVGRVAKQAPRVKPDHRAGELVWSQDGTRWQVVLGPSTFTFDFASAQLLALNLRAINLLTDAPGAALWRAATDNDGVKLWSGQDGKALGRWLRLGLDRLERRPGGCVVKVATKNRLVISLQEHLSGRNRFEDFTLTTRFDFSAENGLRIFHEVRLGAEDLVDLPRIGYRWFVGSGLSTVRFYGRGPHENYPDRKTAAHFGWHEFVAAKELSPYIMPQEYGLRCEVHRIELAGAGSGLGFLPSKPLAFSAIPFRAEQLFAATNASQLIPQNEIVLTIDAAHRGVGTATCGPDTLPPYRVNGRRFTWDYSLEVL